MSHAVAFYDWLIMNTLLKTSCLGIYFLAIVGAITALPFGATSTVQNIAAILLGLHVLELLVTFKSVMRYPGPLIDSIALTLLFGLLHWLPLKRHGSRPNIGV